MKFQLVIIAVLLLSQIYEAKSVPWDHMAYEDGKTDVNTLGNKTPNTSNFLEQMNVCIDICYECFKEDLTLSEDNVPEQSDVLSCANECILKENPVKSLFNWWQKHSFDAKASECLISLVLKNSN